jgi:hypothetical protein
MLNWQRPLWKVDQEVLKRSGRDEVMRVIIHMCMEMIGISLYSYVYLKLAKMSSFLLSLMFLFNKIGEQEGGTEALVGGGK